MPQTDAEEGQAGADGRPHLFDGLRHGPRIAGAIREEQPVGFPGHYFIKRRVARKDAHRAIPCLKHAQDVQFAAVIKDGNTWPGSGAEVVGLLRHHVGSQLQPVHRGQTPGLFDQVLVVEIDRRDDRVHDPFRTNVPHQSSRIDTGDAHQFVASHPVFQRAVGQTVRIAMREGTYHQAGDHRTGGFHVDVHYPVVPDVGVGHHHDLPVVGRIRQDFLVARHAGVEAQLPARLASMPDGNAGHDGSIGQRKLAGIRYRVQQGYHDGLLWVWLRDSFG